ncbi:MAG: LysM peptidoglycan-binding domain-containing protein [Desulfobacteraceae bacterium]|jgi:LysM repeat protein|nr:LysM peptidoglycan-binding domain-containing protein [Desulfobacteraceae bacterium]
MAEYVVKPGDTLSKIATSKLGSAGQWRVIAELNGIVNPNRIRVGQRLQLPGAVTEVSSVVNTSAGVQAAGKERVRISVEDKVVYATLIAKPEKIFVGRLHRKGLYRVGLHEPENFIANHRVKLQELNLTDSEMNVIFATAENEGNLDAVNTWDNQFMSFGMFQWTAGGAGKPGELPALLKIIKDSYPDNFQQYWGQFGLDVVDVGNKTGWFSYRGEKLVSAAEKSILREHIWAYRFARAGADIEVQAAQVRQAANRIKQFYFVSSSKLNGYSLADLITSEYGVALLLDNHVNRPGYVHSCLAEALARSNLSAEKLARGGDEEEQLVIRNYLDVRETYGRYPMTDARQRASVTRGYVVDGIISSSRGSLVTMA